MPCRRALSVADTATCGAGTPGALSVRPAGGGSRRGVVRVDTAVDLGWLARAVDEHWARIPADTLSASPAAVELPRYRLDAVVVEPYAQTDRCCAPQLQA